MTADAAGPVEAVLAEHAGLDWDAPGGAVACRCGWSVTYNRPRETRDLWGMYHAHVAAALAPLFAEHGAAERRAGSVEALNEAADGADLLNAPLWGDWLRARADAIPGAVREGGDSDG